MDQQLFDLIENTQRNVFLTGRAGTGKTTFLNQFVINTNKKTIVVAPTGIAAINAGGVTIHSMFGLPLRTFVPTMDRVDANIANNISDLLQHLYYRKDKIKLLREVELIIVDEVSMMRSDVLDMVDLALKSVRRSPEKFGGVQMLFIGDLYQLPPVVRDEAILTKFYKSPFFFDSYVLKDNQLLTVELTKVYRQTDGEFLEILNAIREGDSQNIDFNKLNKRYIPDFKPKDKNYVYLTSHNRMADKINQEQLKALKSKSHFFRAEIEGNFKENQYPNDELLELKIGAQIMFIRNDPSTEKKYYNGKLAEIKSISEDEILVNIENGEQDYILKKETWEQKKYSLSSDKTIREDVIGSFTQYPIRLAWAVTIHKSQGLTFDRLIIDAGKSFASGQVYVALSRCRTLEGIVLQTKIPPHAIHSDPRIAEFQTQTNANEKIEEILQSEKYDFVVGKVMHCLNPSWLLKETEKWYKLAKQSKKLEIEKVEQLYTTMKLDIDRWIKVFEKFRAVILFKTKKYIENKINWLEIEDKCKGAVQFFFLQIKSQFLEPFMTYYVENKGAVGLKGYNEETYKFLEEIKDYLKTINGIKLLNVPLYQGTETIEDSTTKIAKIPSHILSYQLLEEGKSITEIAKERGLVKETIFGHLAKFASQGILDLSRVISDSKLMVFEKVFEESHETVESLKDWKNILPPEFEFNEIRLLLNHFTHLKEKENSN